ncbi:MAG: endonuclease [Bacteroidetes bacterium]|nr:endonuclease [Bacteroidota bacterium]
MKKISLLVLSLFVTSLMMAQQTGYYNGTESKNGEELKSALNDIIQDHTSYSYYFSKEIFKLSDADTANPDNVIQVYTGFSHDNSDYGTSGLALNREHVWAKSHGSFADWPPMYGDVHNLKPAAASVNQDKSNLDFDNGGTQHDIALGCYYTDSTWEARNEVKGDIARIIFYMATRYEGENGELDLEVVDWNNTYPLAQHGKLSTLLEWNLLDPPDEFERNRNNVIYSFQQNRNPFIDDPNFAELIWDETTPNAISIDNFQITPQIAVAGELLTIEATITNLANQAVSASLFWGLSFEVLTNEIIMTEAGEVFSCDIPGQAEDARVYYKIVAADINNENTSVVYNYYVPKIFTGTIVSIYDIQGQQPNSPYEGETVSTSGVVTANFGSSYFIQDGSGRWNGLFIYESGRNPSVGDSIVLTGLISEYYGKTEMSDISDYYFISANNTLPNPVVVQSGNVEEAHESVLVKVNNAMCTDDNYQANFYMWEVNDGTGPLKIHNTSVYEYEPSEGSYYNITGPMNYDFDEWKIELRFESDVTDGGDTDGPVVNEVTPVISTNIKIFFNEDVETTTAENASNYMINNGVVVESVVQHAFNKSQVNLTVTPLSGDYELTVQNVKDISGNVMEVQTIPFSYVGIEEYLMDGKVEVFPNPASDHVNISFVATEEFEFNISVSDISGKQLIVEEYFAEQGVNKYNLDLNGFKQGVYLMSLRGEKGTLNYKLIIR